LWEEEKERKKQLAGAFDLEALLSCACTEKKKRA